MVIQYIQGKKSDLKKCFVGVHVLSVLEKRIAIVNMIPAILKLYLFNIDKDD